MPTMINEVSLVKNFFEEDIAHSNSYLNAVFSSINQSFVIIDKYMILRWYNKKAYDLWAGTWNIELETGKYITDFLDQSHKHSIMKEIETAFSGKQITTEKMIKSTDNQVLWFDVSITPQYTDDELDFILINIQDITGRKQVIYDIEQHDNILSVLNFAAEKFISSQNIELAINDVFDRIGKALKVTSIYLVENKTDSNLYPFMKLRAEWNADPDSIKSPLNRIFNTYYSISGIERWYAVLYEQQIFKSTILQLPAAERLLFEKNISKSIILLPIFVDNLFWGFLCFEDGNQARKWNLAEIDALKMAVRLLSAEIKKVKSNNELFAAKELAVRSDTLKTHFLAQMSHEIRTPLNVILNFTSLLKDEFSGTKRKDLQTYFKMIENGSKRIIRTIEMILNMSELQSQTYDYLPTEFDISDSFFESILLEYRAAALEKNLQLIFTKHISSAFILADIYSVTQIFNNLLDNAVKYTNKGKIEITLYGIDDTKIGVDIEDTGIGISSEYSKELFTPFSQEETGYTRRFEGLGLGLSLVKRFVELNDAQIIVRSSKNIGSRFTIIFKKTRYEEKK